MVGLKKCFKLIRRIRKIRTKVDFNLWLHDVAWQLGRIDGCLRFRVWAI
jgi:hypothetical protein